MPRLFLVEIIEEFWSFIPTSMLIAVQNIAEHLPWLFNLAWLESGMAVT